VAVASQLILIKSRAMLPAPPEPPALPGEEPPDPEEELRRRLLVYRVYRDAGQRLNLLLEEPRRLVHREAAVAAASGLAGARPAERAPYEVAWLVAALRRASDLALPPAPPPEVVARVITLTERAALIRRALAEAPLVVLQELLAGTQDRVLVAVTFLALLELIKRREVVAEQDVPWGPIRCRRTTTEERAAAGVAEAPPSPIDESLADFA
jgi:segregation and condensation protein A